MDRNLQALTLMSELRPTRRSEGVWCRTATAPELEKMTPDAYLANVSHVYGRTAHADTSRNHCAPGKYDLVSSIASAIIALR